MNSVQQIDEDFNRADTAASDCWHDLLWLQSGVLAIAIHADGEDGDGEDCTRVVRTTRRAWYSDPRWECIYTALADILDAGNRPTPDIVRTVLQQRKADPSLVDNLARHDLARDWHRLGDLLRAFEDAALLYQAQKAVDCFGRTVGNPLFDRRGVIEHFRCELGGLLDEFGAGEPESQPRRYSQADLQHGGFAPPPMLVPNLLPVGLTVLGGRPKAGKSWQAVHLAVAAAGGGRFLGQPVEQVRVLYLALEDCEWRIAERLQRMGAAEGLPIEWAFEWLALDAGGVEALAREIDSDRYGLVVVDVYNRLRGALRADDAARVGDQWRQLQNLTKGRKVGLLLLDHHNKGARSVHDPIDNIMDTSEKAAAVDTAWGLYSAAGATTSTLMVIGRDIESRTLKLKFDGLTGAWQIAGGDLRPAESLTGQLQAVYEAVRTQPGCGSRELATALGEDPGNTQRRLTKLVKDGLLERRESADGVTYWICQEEEE
jgi:hypothetical protein